jgi:hypothetical protein
MARGIHSVLVNLTSNGVQVGRKQCHYKWPKAMQILKMPYNAKLTTNEWMLEHQTLNLY